MGDLRVENVKIQEEFVSVLAGTDTPLPWNMATSADGTTWIVDANGQEILALRPFEEWNELQRRQIACAIVIAVNTCGGFRAVKKDTREIITKAGEAS